MSDFNPEFFDSLCKSIKAALDNGASPIAAFDADGTLWSGDAGLDFYKYQIENNLLEGLPENPWESYLEYVEKKETEALFWLAQINKGHPITTVRSVSYTHLTLPTICSV